MKFERLQSEERGMICMTKFDSAMFNTCMFGTIMYSRQRQIKSHFTKPQDQWRNKTVSHASKTISSWTTWQDIRYGIWSRFYDDIQKLGSNIERKMLLRKGKDYWETCVYITERKKRVFRQRNYNILSNYVCQIVWEIKAEGMMDWAANLINYN